MYIVFWALVVLLAVTATLWGRRRTRRRIAAIADGGATPVPDVGRTGETGGPSGYGVHRATITGQGPTFGPWN